MARQESRQSVVHTQAVKMQKESVLIIIMGCDDVQLVECLPGMREAVGVGCTPVTSALGLWRHEDQKKLKVILGYMGSQSLAWIKDFVWEKKIQ